jgi:hypothetical protein
MHPVDFVNICINLATVLKSNLSELLNEIFYILQEVRLVVSFLIRKFKRTKNFLNVLMRGEILRCWELGLN